MNTCKYRFNSRTPCGVRHKCSVLTKYKSCFNSRTPCGVRRQRTSLRPPHLLVSIHAPRAGCDNCLIIRHIDLASFNSRTPCGVRLPGTSTMALPLEFQFTHPVRGATANRALQHRYIVVSIHAPRAGCDQQTSARWGSPFRVSIHAPRAGCDTYKTVSLRLSERFNSRTPCGVRLRCSKVRINRGLDDDPLRTED